MNPPPPSGLNPLLPVSETLPPSRKQMNELEIKIDPKVRPVFDRYPDEARDRLLMLRALVIEVATATDGITAIEETLKWGEPSYLTKNGSTIRMDWKPAFPKRYALYFKCTSRLVETFKLVFDDSFDYEGNRAIIFQFDEAIPKENLKRCIKAALTYHKVKHLPTLGM